MANGPSSWMDLARPRKRGWGRPRSNRFQEREAGKNSPKIDLVKLSVVDDDKVDADVVTSLKDFDVRRLVVDVVNKKDVKKVENIFFSNGFRILESDSE